MKRFYRLLKRKRNVRRMLAAAFVVIAFIEIGSHAFTDTQDIAHFETLGFCGIQHDAPPSVDSPAKQKQRGPNSNLLDEMTTHAVILNHLTFPRTGVSYWTDETTDPILRSLSGSPTIPFHPPKQA